jgi:hypothetical protein
MNTVPTETPKQYQCRHIFTDGHRCASPCLRHEEFCYYHHTTRRPVENPRQRRSRRSTFHLPLPEDRSAIQSSIGQVLQRIAANDIDPRRAGLLLYGLQIASLNLPKPQPAAARHRKHEDEVPETVEEIVIDPQLGALAPRAEIGKEEKPLSVIGALLQKMMTKDQQAAEEKTNPNPQSEPTTIPTLQATEDNPATNAVACSPSSSPKSCRFDRSIPGALPQASILPRLWRSGRRWSYRHRQHVGSERLRSQLYLAIGVTPVVVAASAVGQ